MKKIYLLIFCSSIAGATLTGQTILTYKSHGLMPGTSHDFIFTNNKEEGSSGANINWDYSDLIPSDKNLTSHMLSPLNLEKSSEIPLANTVIEEFGNLFYFKVNQALIEQYGEVTCNVITIYDKPLTKLKFPFSYGDKVYGNYSGIQQSDNIKIPVEGTYEIFADAYGTLILPGNIAIKNVLRVKQTRTIHNDKSGIISEITYRWYTDNVRYPLLVIVKYITPKSSYISQTAMYAHAGDRTKSTTALSEIESLNEFSAYPSPYQDQLNISYEIEQAGNVQIDLFDMSGRLTKTILTKTKQIAGFHNISVNDKEIKLFPGIYYVRLSVDNKTFMKKVIKL
jgi:hypothetical protein